MTDFNEMKLGVIAPKHIWRDPEGIKTTGGFGRQIEEISQYFGGTVLALPFEKRHTATPGYVIKIENLEVIPLPYFSGVGFSGKLRFLTRAPLIGWRVWRAYGRCDILHHRVPGYVGIIGLLVHRIRRARPSFSWVAGDWPERIRQTNNSWFRRLSASIVQRTLYWMLGDIPTFVVDKGIVGRSVPIHPYVHRTVTTVVSERDIYDVADARLQDPVRLLFVGRLTATKGIYYLLDAVSICVDNGKRVVLKIVGDGPERRRIETEVESRDMTSYVDLQGYVPLGKGLWEAYRSADVFVIPSLSEGQPKVVIEAMASGLVVIATRVGGIPSVIEDGVTGLLVQPRSSEGIASAVERVICEPLLRERLVKKGLEVSRGYTIEKQSEQLIKDLRSDLQSLAARPRS